MGYVQQYISDHYDEVEDLWYLTEQVGRLGFDPVREVPKTFSHFQITEGLEIYEEIRQNLQMKLSLDSKDALLSFVFRAMREENEADFKLVEIEAKLYSIEGDQMSKIAERSFGEKSGFPTKDRMVQDVCSDARQLRKLYEIKEKFGIGLNYLLNKTPYSRRAFKRPLR